MPLSIAKRRLQFIAGPERTTFYACTMCKPLLEKIGHEVHCHYPISQEPLEDVDLEDEIECDLCREG